MCPTSPSFRILSIYKITPIEKYLPVNSRGMLWGISRRLYHCREHRDGSQCSVFLGDVTWGMLVCLQSIFIEVFAVKVWIETCKDREVSWTSSGIPTTGGARPQGGSPQSKCHKLPLSGSFGNKKQPCFLAFLWLCVLAVFSPGIQAYLEASLFQAWFPSNGELANCK